VVAWLSQAGAWVSQAASKSLVEESSSAVSPVSN
jgi:hypothetical protein